MCGCVCLFVCLFLCFFSCSCVRVSQFCVWLVFFFCCSAACAFVSAFFLSAVLASVLAPVLDLARYRRCYRLRKAVKSADDYVERVERVAGTVMMA